MTEAVPTTTPDSDDEDTIAFVQELYSEARKEKKRLTPRWDKYYRLLENETWPEFRPSWLPSPSSSEIYPTIHSLTAWMTEHDPVALLFPRPKKEFDKAWVDARTIDASTFIQSWLVAQRIKREIRMTLWDTFTFGTGVLKTGFDPSLEDTNGRPTFTRVDPYNIYPDPSGSNEDDIRYIVECRDATLYEIRSRFPERGHKVKPEGKTEDKRPRLKGPELVPMGNLSATGVTGEWPGTATPGIPSRFGPPSGANKQDYTGTARLFEVWVKSTRRTTVTAITGQEVSYESPEWKYIAMAGNVVLTEEVSNPFDHGQHPYCRLPMVDYGEWWGPGLVQHLAPIQLSQNRLLAALQINAELTGNPIFVEDERSGTAHTKLIARPGARITKNPGSEIGWLNPPTVSPLMRDLVFFYRDQIDRISGISAVARGENLRRREPGSAVDAVQEASFVRIRSIVSNMEECLRRGCDQVMSNVVQFMTEPHAVPLVGPQGDSEVLLLEPRHWQFPVQTLEGTTYEPLEFKVFIEAGSSLPTSRQVKAEEADILYGMGLIPGEDVLKSHNWPDRQKALEKGKDESLQRSFNALAQKGQKR